MSKDWRLWVALFLFILSVAVDFTSQIMSVLGDGLFVAGGLILIWKVINCNEKPR